MKKIGYRALLILLVFAFTAAYGQGITYTFANGQITGTSPTYYEFDIMVQASASGTQIGTCQAYLNYNATGFGTQIKDNGHVTVTHGTLFTGVGFDAFYTIILNDNGASTLSILFNYLLTGNGSFAPTLPTSATQWAHVKIEIQNSSVGAGLSFASGLMANQSFDYQPVNYSPVTATATDNSSLPVQMTQMEGESTSEGIVLSWETASEVNSQGYRVWRSGASDGDYEQITTRLIPSEGNSSSGASYTFTDRNFEANATYYYKIEQLDADGGSRMFHAIEVIAEFVPTVYALRQNYPNPFNPLTNFTYDVPELSDVQIRVYNLLGREVSVIFNEQQQPGRYTETWDGTDHQGRKLASGIYFLRMQAGDFTQMRKMTLLR